MVAWDRANQMIYAPNYVVATKKEEKEKEEKEKKKKEKKKKKKKIKSKNG